MDQQRFDAALRALQAGTTRRAGLAGMLGVLLGGVGAGSRKRAAARGPEIQLPCGDGSPGANKCKTDGDCCTKYCPDGQCRFKANWMACRNDGECSSGRCVGGRCDGGCNPADSRCQENFNCCDGLACGNGTCKKSTSVKCTKQNCSGCCDGTTCRPGGSEAACGAKGAACVRCKGGVTCANGTCGAVCNAKTCPKGCCRETVCLSGADVSACGTGGAACQTCPAGGTCENKACVPPCSPATCPAGCCKNGRCKPGTENAACGMQGGECAVCSGETTCKVIEPYRACLGCLSDQDCGGAKPVCDLNTQTCVQCLDSSNCPSCEICLSQTCSPPGWSAQTTFGSGPGSGASQFSSPNGLAVSGDGLEVYVSDALNYRIDLWTRSSTASNTWTNLTSFGSYSDFGLPDGVAVSSDKLTAFVVGGTGNVVVYTRPGTTGANATNWTKQTTIGTFSNSQPVPADQFNSPRNLFVTADMLTIYVADSGAQRISVWSRPDTTTNATAWTHQYNFGSTGMEDIVVSVDGLTAWVGESQNVVSVWTRPDTTTNASAWASQTTFGEYGSDLGQISGLGQLAVTPDGLTVLVSDFGNSRVDLWTRTDTASTEWTAQTPFGGDGTATCQMKQPAGVSMSADGSGAFVADFGNNRITTWKKI